MRAPPGPGAYRVLDAISHLHHALLSIGVASPTTFTMPAGETKRLEDALVWEFATLLGKPGYATISGDKLTIYGIDIMDEP